MVEVIFVHVGVHPDALLPEHLVVLRARQRREEKQLEDVERQLSLDDLNVPQDRLFAVTREADDVTGTGDGAMVAPFLQHLPVVGNLVLALLGGNEIVGVDVLEPNEYPAHACACCLLDEIRDLVAERVDLDGKPDLGAICGPQRDQAIEQRFPVAVAGEIVVGDEKSPDVLGIVVADDLLHVVRRTESALAPLHVDDGAEGALVWTAATEIHARERSSRPADVASRQNWRRFPLQIGQMIHVIVERRKPAIPGIPEHLVEAAFLGLPGKQ